MNERFLMVLSRVGPLAPHFGQTPWNRFGARLAKSRRALCGRTDRAERIALAEWV